MFPQISLSIPSMALRALPGNRVGGILVPFNTKDKYGTWWDRASDLKIGLYRDVPMFYWHLLKSKGTEEIMRAGTLPVESFAIRDEGLYVEGELLPNSAGDAINELVAANNAAWSSGALPQAIRVRDDGYVECWPIMEGSVASREGVVSMRGTTTAYHVRSMLQTISEEAEKQPLSRSIWIMPPESTAAAPVAPQTPPPAQMSEADIQRIVAAMAANQPTRALPPQPEPPTEATRATSDIQVSSPYDNVSLLGLCFYDEMNRVYAHSRSKPWVRDEKFMRALVDKARVIKEREDQAAALVVVPEGHIHFRAVDDEAYEKWHKRIPHLRASEVMGSTVAGFGDELVPTLLSSAVWLGFRLATKVFGLLSAVRPTSNPWNYPTMISGPTTRKVTETVNQSTLSLTASPYTTSKIATDKVAFTSLGKIGALSVLSYELFQDAGINVADAAAERFMRSMADSVDNVLINGDEAASTSNISHLGADPTGTAYDQYLLVDGLRKMAFTDSTTVADTTVSSTYLTTIQQKMGARGRIGLDLPNIVSLVDPGVYYKMLAVAELLTVQNYGPQAVIHTGEVASMKGVPVVVSDQIENTNSAGKMASTHDGTLGSSLVVHTNLVKVAVWRDIDIVKWDVPEADAFAIKGSVRLDLNRLESGAVAYGYNTTV